MAGWYSRLADVPQTEYAVRTVDRTKLALIGLRPERGDEINGETYYWWPVGKHGSTSASPVQQHGVGKAWPKTPAALLRRIDEVLELPGTPSDYHFFLQAAIEELWKFRASAPDVLPEVERLAWLDLRLVTSAADPAASHNEGERSAFGVRAFSLLKRLYLLNGDLEGAWQVEQHARRHGQQNDVTMDEIHTRLLAEANATLV
ncbi:hypothetical protein [Deinococcus sonorensis]|uniref:Uncharacterized protein n=1 Tax=Deinococcus sonorensis TaxID=309891 RepID=A0ABV8YAL6_9DEIO